MPRLNQKYGPRPSEVGRRIRAERERLGLTQEECARRLGLRRNTYKNLEATANPQASTLIGLADIGFDVARIYPEPYGLAPTAPVARPRPFAGQGGGP